jgi:hypothetical protein
MVVSSKTLAITAASTKLSSYGPDFDREYDQLPESLKMIYTPKDYAWMTPERRAKLIEEETMPDCFED